jgi:hypothetical protein
MTLVWSQIIRLSQWGDDWAPKDSDEDVHPGEIESHRGSWELNQHHVNRLADSIRQHGYSPERHGVLGWNFHQGGENVYNHASGTETDPNDHLHHEHLLQALKDVGHGPVRVHIHDQDSDERGNSPRYYHGTTVEDLKEVKPNHSTRGSFGNNGAIHEPGYAYATSRENAESYAESKAEIHGGRPLVYRVSPLGPVEKDPSHDAQGRSRANYESDVRSKHGFQVLDHVWSGEHPDGDEAWHDDEDDYDGGWH